MPKDWRHQLEQELKNIKTASRQAWPVRLLEAFEKFEPLRKEKSFVSYTRWYDFIVAAPSDQAMQFNPASHTLGDNFFDCLVEDMESEANPVSVVISTFISACMDDFHDSVQSMREASREQAMMEFRRLVDQVKLCKTLTKHLLSSYYVNISILLSQYHAQISVLVYAQLVKAEVYRMLHFLASVVTSQSQSKLLVWETTPGFPAALSRTVQDPAFTAVYLVVKQGLSRFIACESPYEKLHFFKEAWEALEAFSACRPGLLAWAVVDLKLKSFEADLLILEELCGVSKVKALQEVRASLALL
jgi:hypothetical protein